MEQRFLFVQVGYLQGVRSSQDRSDWCGSRYLIIFPGAGGDVGERDRHRLALRHGRREHRVDVLAVNRHRH